jgi:hypothetical protein
MYENVQTITLCKPQHAIDVAHRRNAEATFLNTTSSTFIDTRAAAVLLICR